jgi:hypothetical protein
MMSDMYTIIAQNLYQMGAVVPIVKDNPDGPGIRARFGVSGDAKTPAEVKMYAVVVNPTLFPGYVAHLTNLETNEVVWSHNDLWNNGIVGLVEMAAESVGLKWPQSGLF